MGARNGFLARLGVLHCPPSSLGQGCGSFSGFYDPPAFR